MLWMTCGANMCCTHVLWACAVHVHTCCMCMMWVYDVGIWCGYMLWVYDVGTCCGTWCGRTYITCHLCNDLLTFLKGLHVVSVGTPENLCQRERRSLLDNLRSHRTSCFGKPTLWVPLMYAVNYEHVVRSPTSSCDVLSTACRPQHVTHITCRCCPQHMTHGIYNHTVDIWCG